MRHRFALTALLLAVLPVAAPAGESPIVLRWFPSPSEPPVWDAILPAPGDGQSPLIHTPSFPPVGPLRIALLDGTRFDLAEARGRIVLLDFWASWCSPCLRELPHLQALWERRRGAGLTAIAVNAEEPEALVRRTATQLGLTLPVGMYDSALEERFGVRTLPTVVLLDREGRLRARWDGYVEGLEETIAKRVEALLDGDREAVPTELARVDPGRMKAEIAWSAEFAEPVGGVAFFRTSDGAAAVAATSGSSLTLLDAAGRPVGRFRVPQDVHKILPAAPTANREPRLLAWREGGDRAVEIRPESEQVRAVIPPSVVWDLAEVAASTPEDAGLVWATPVGVWTSSGDGSSPRRIGDPFPARRVAPGPRASGRSFLVVDGDGGFRFLRDEASEGVRPGIPRGAGLVRGAGGAFGIFAPPVLDALEGSFTGSGTRAVALGAAPDRLVLVDAAGGARVWSATWEGVFDLHAGDLDGDGIDELLVASGKRVTAVRFRLE